MTREPVTVLVVDDSIIFRKAIRKALEGQSGISVVGTAQDGREALDQIAALSPEVVTLDLKMPSMDGLTTLREMRRLGLKARVVVLSAHGGERQTLDALYLGAEDFLLKPSVGEDSFERLQAELLQKIRRPSRSIPRSSRPEPMPARGPRAEPCELVVIGVSTGGPNALAELFKTLPSPFPTPVLVVQHMPADFTRILAERLHQVSPLPVSEATHGQVAERGHAYLAPGDFHLVVEGTRERPTLRLHQAPPENSCRPAVDVLFRSAASLFGSRCLAVVLTGMGKDGLEGTRAIVRGGGQALAQDRESSVVWGMPRFLVESGLAPEVPLAEMGSRIAQSVGGSWA